MTSGYQAPLNDLVTSLVTAGTSLAQAALALFHLILAFGHIWFDKVAQFAQTCIQLGLDLFRGVAGFVVANFFVLLVLAGGYYWWTTQSHAGKRSRAVTTRK